MSDGHSTRARPPAGNSDPFDPARTPTWSLTEAARRIGVSRSTVYHYVQTGRLPAVQVDTVWRVRHADVRAECRRRRGIQLLPDDPGPGTFCCWCYQESGELAFSHWTNDCYGLNARFEHEDCARNRLYHRTGFERLEELTERLRAENAMLEAKLRGGPLLQLVPAGS